ncbi:MAG: ExbD/TolR family protein [Alphaproteobacteria bacterium]
MKTSAVKKKLRINIIPLIDIIFLMLVFFMLATNFSEKREVSLSIKKQTTENSSNQKNLIIKIKNDEFYLIGEPLKKKELEKEIIKLTNSNKFENIVILNDENSKLQQLIFLLDLLKTNNIQNVTFADDPKL